MTAYVKKEGGKRFGAKGGKASFASRSGKPGFEKKNFDRSDDRAKTLYKATCSNCGESCDVPFKPVNGKPVFCRNCFVKTADTATAGRAGDRFAKREFTPRNAAPQSDSNAAVLKQLEIMNAKLERLIAAVESGRSAA